MLLSSLLVGCSSFNSKEVWPKPQKPNIATINYVHMPDVGIKTNGYYLSEMDIDNLVNNIQELQYYIKKLELLLDSMAKVYNVKWEMYEPSKK